MELKLQNAFTGSPIPPYNTDKESFLLVKRGKYNKYSIITTTSYHSVIAKTSTVNQKPEEEFFQTQNLPFFNVENKFQLIYFCCPHDICVLAKQPIIGAGGN